MTYRTMMRQYPEAEFRLEEAAWLQPKKSSLKTIDDPGSPDRSSPSLSWRNGGIEQA